MKYLLHLSYQGLNYRGWQRQARVVSVQQTIEDKIISYIKEKIFIVGCGRTDAGVHATNYVAHLEVTDPLPEQFLFVINKMLPDDIAIMSAELVGDHSQAQFHVEKRRYDYFLHTTVDPMLAGISTYYEGGALDIALMNEAISMIQGVKNFIAFCKQPHLYDHTNCEIFEAKVLTQGSRIQIRIVGNRFLRSMVRLLVGNLLLVGSGEMPLSEWKSLLLADKVPDHFRLAYPQGLHLSGIWYPQRVFDRESVLSLVD